jgi:hypothetical protein
MGFRWGALMSGDLSSPVKPARVRRLYCDPAILNLAISNVAEAVTVAYAALPVVTGLSAVVERVRGTAGAYHKHRAADGV